MPQKITVLLFARGTSGHPIENLVARAQMAASLDTLEKLRGLPEIGEMVVATANAEFAAQCAALGARIEMDPPGADFHFGRRLAALVTRYRAEVPLYVGGGSGALMRVEDWQNLVGQVLENPGSVLPNNFFSCDFAVWSPGHALERIEPPELDNDLAYRLNHRAGLKWVPLAKDAATQLDIDTPSDLQTLAFHPGVGPHLHTLLETLDLDTTRVRQIRSLLKTPSATLLIAGRVSAPMALFLERATPCQWRILSEERGMRASGREARGEVRSLLGFYIERAGATGLFIALAQLAGGALVDSRVLFAHLGLRPTAPDRFFSDLLQPDQVHDPFIRDLTTAARDCGIPILLGGHSLVSGGVYALVEQ